jgi:hypothetical protein
VKTSVLEINATVEVKVKAAAEVNTAVEANIAVEVNTAVVAYCTCVFGLIKMKFRRLISLISDDVLCCSVFRGRRLI